MTGSIQSPGRPMGWGHEGRLVPASDEDDDDATNRNFPPKYAYLILQTGKYKAAFCDPRKFGKAELVVAREPSDNNGNNSQPPLGSALDALAPDAWQGNANDIIPRLTNQKRACAGVGNWVADEVLYQCRMHPDQNYLTTKEATHLVHSLQSILGTAVGCLAKHVPYPSDWLFPYRWTKKKAGKDGLGRSIAFVQSGGRTTAIIASLQKLYKRKRDTNPIDSSKNSSNKRIKKDHTETKATTRKDASVGDPSNEIKVTKSKVTTRKDASVGDPSNEIKVTKSKRPGKEKDGAVSNRKSRTPTPTTTMSPQEKPRRRSPRFVSP